MNPHKEVQVSPQPVLNFISPEDHKELMDYFILEKTCYAINSYIKWFGVNPWKRQVDENGKSTLHMIKPMKFWLQYVITLVIITALWFPILVYVCIFYVTWDDIVQIDSHLSESIIDTFTGYVGTIVVFFLYWPFVFKLRQFGEGIVQAQEHFKYWNNEPRKSNGKISICTGMYDSFEPQLVKYIDYDFLKLFISLAY